MKIVILDGYTLVQEDLTWDGLKEFGELTYYERTGEDQILHRIKNAHMVITSKCKFTEDIIDSAPNLKYIGVVATGYNNIDVAYANKKGIVVTNIPAYSTDSVAQFTFSLILEAANRVGLHNESVRRGDWAKSVDFCYTLTPQTELAGKTIGIIGYGDIGAKVSSLAKAFGLNVLVFSSHMTKSKDVSTTEGIRFVSLDELLRASDIITLHSALTDENRGMINSESIGLMKDGVILINTSRGPLIDEYDLVDALKEGKVGLAAMDVLPVEPPTEDSPLVKLPNCLITPHMAWNTIEARRRLIAIACDNIRSFLRGKPVNRIL